MFLLPPGGAPASKKKDPSPSLEIYSGGGLRMSTRHLVQQSHSQNASSSSNFQAIFDCGRCLRFQGPYIGECRQNFFLSIALETLSFVSDVASTEDKSSAQTVISCLSGLDHLLYLGRGAGGREDEATELKVACFMGLVSFLASRQEVLRVAPRRPVKMLDASVRGIIQTATPTSTPLTAAGLDGTGEVIQV